MSFVNFYICLQAYVFVAFLVGTGQNTEGMHLHSSTVRELHRADMPLKLPLPTFGLASYKFEVTFWNTNGVYECQKAGSLLKAADNWLRLWQVNHPDYRFFVSHNTSPR
jgi:hypothetical protein